MNRLEQDRIFERNAHIRQKIVGTAMCIIILAVWSWLLSFDVVHIWYAVLVIPAIMFGVWLISTDRLLMEEIMEGGEQ